MGIDNSLQMGIMLLCFGTAGVVLAAAGHQQHLLSANSQSPQPPLSASAPQPTDNWQVRRGSATGRKKLGVLRAYTQQQTKVQTALPLTPKLTQAMTALSSRVVIDLSEAKVYSYWGEYLIASYPVAVGKPGWETPLGTFEVLNMKHNPTWQQPITGELIPAGPDNPLGERWIGFWTDGYHQIGLHGTNQEESIGQPISHGCVRMRNEDIRELFEQVTIGTSVVVRQ